MNDYRPNLAPVHETDSAGTVQPVQEIPQFGAVDIIDAFTAMRHECRGQIKESRTLTEQIQSAVSAVQSLESKLLTAIKDARPDEQSELKKLVLWIADLDHQLTRAITGVEQWESTCRQRDAEKAAGIQNRIVSMNGLARWFARPLISLIVDKAAANSPIQANPALEGLNMVLARLRRSMRDQGIERLDVLGQPFDAATMHAIGTRPSSDYPPGSVAEQISPAYFWQGKLLRFADVRIAESGIRAESTVPGIRSDKSP